MTNEPALPGQVQPWLLGLASRTEGQAPSHSGTIIVRLFPLIMLQMDVSVLPAPVPLVPWVPFSLPLASPLSLARFLPYFPSKYNYFFVPLSM
jgi:hypothetical protein